MTRIKIVYYFLLFTSMSVIGINCHQSNDKAIPIDHNAIPMDDLRKLSLLGWETTLDKSHIPLIINSINSSSGSGVIQYTGLFTLGVFMDDKSLIEALTQVDQCELPPFSQDLLNILIESVSAKEGFDQKLINCIDAKKLAKNVNYVHYSSIDDALLNILVIRCSKLLRGNKACLINIDNDLLTIGQYNTIEYSKLDKTEAIEKLIAKISSGGHEGNDNYAELQTLPSILFTYGKEGAVKIIETLLNSTETITMSQHGMRDFMEVLNSSFITIPDNLKGELQNFLSSEDVQEKYFKSLYGQSQLLELNYKLDGLSNEEIELKLLELRKKNRPVESEKKLNKALFEKFTNEIKSTQREIIVPELPIEPNRILVEEQGEDFTKKSTPILFRYLKKANFSEIYNTKFLHQSVKAIELRKVANALGDRYLAGELEMTDEQKQVINQVVLKYIELGVRYTKAPKPGSTYDFQEAKLQLIRFSGIVVPALFKYLDNPDPYISHFSTETLSDLKNEEITTKFIQKALTTTDLNQKRELLRFFGNFKNPTPTYLEKRPPQDKETTKKLYEEIVLPAKEKIKKELGQ